MTSFYGLSASDVLCLQCGEPSDVWDMLEWERALMLAGAGCPCCEGEEYSTDETVRLELLEGFSRTVNPHDTGAAMSLLSALDCGFTVSIPPWEAPEPETVWECEGCKVKLVKSLDIPGDFEWHGGKRVHYSGYTDYPYRYGYLYNHEKPQFGTGEFRKPEPQEPFTLDGNTYCPGCAEDCDGSDCDAVIFRRTELQGDTYDPGTSFPDPTLCASYSRDSYCVDCFESFPSCAKCDEYFAPDTEELNENGECDSCALIPECAECEETGVPLDSGDCGECAKCSPYPACDKCGDFPDTFSALFPTLCFDCGETTNQTLSLFPGTNKARKEVR